MAQSILTKQIEDISLFNIGLNAYGQIRRKKKVSIWSQGENPREVLVGNIINSTNRAGQEIAETLSRGSVIMSCKVDEPSKLCEHPVESGTVITDHKVIEPKRCTVTIAMPAYFQQLVIEELTDYYAKSTPLSVHDVGGIYTNMIIVNKPHETVAKTADRLIFTVEMKQIIVVSSQYVKLDKSKVKFPKDASTANKGVKQPKTDTSILKDIANSGVFKKTKDAISSWWSRL